MERLLFVAISPASIELSLNAAQQIEAERERLASHHRQTVERTRYQSELARGRYESVDHRNRLVAAELERRWEAALLEQRTTEESLGRFLQQRPLRLTAHETGRIQSLAADIPALWRTRSTSGIERQRILRALVEQVVVEVIDQSERVAVSIRWAGGFDSEHEIRRAVGKFEQLESASEIRSRIIALKQQGHTHEAVAQRLNAAQFHSTSGDAFTSPIVSQLCRKFRAEGYLKDDGVTPSRHCHWKLGGLAKELGVPGIRIEFNISGRRQQVWLVHRNCKEKSVHPTGLEPVTFGSVDRCSIQLS